MNCLRHVPDRSCTSMHQEPSGTSIAQNCPIAIDVFRLETIRVGNSTACNASRIRRSFEDRTCNPESGKPSQSGLWSQHVRIFLAPAEVGNWDDGHNWGGSSGSGPANYICRQLMGARRPVTTLSCKGRDLSFSTSHTKPTPLHKATAVGSPESTFER